MTRKLPVPGLALIAILLLALAGGPAPAAAQAPGAAPAGLRLPAIFTDGLVLQREAPLPVWGWAPPGESVTVAFRGASRSVRAGADGSWRVILPAQQPGGPYELTVSAGGGRTTLHDVLVGDVWLASGQSNMEFTLRQAQNGPAEAAAAHDSLLRQFYVQHTYAPTPQADLKGGPWQSADAAHAPYFTAVGYYFAKDLRSALHVPVGIIHSSWGGANIETWISGHGLGLTEAVLDSIRAADRAYGSTIRDSLRARIGGLPTVDSGVVAGKAVWADPALDDASWSTLRVPGTWEGAGYPGLDGVAWYRTAVELGPADLTKPVRLVLGSIDDNDSTWVNGVLVGHTEAYDAPRDYAVPATALRQGRNVIAVRVVDSGGEGGIIGRPGPVYLDVGGERRSLAGTWKFRVGIVGINQDGQRINKVPAFLYHAMIHPVLDYPIKGVIWYQGESNANNDEQARAYAPLMKALISSWRSEWRGEPRTLQPFPFLWVQLPNYMKPDTVPPATAGWALLRESQSAALSLPKTGQAVIIDVGEAGDIHPKNKETVGKRLALVGLKVAYGRDVEASGPTYRSHSMADGKVSIAFEHAAGLTSKTGDLKGFAIAGADRKFVWASARIEGERVVVWSERVPDPAAVRYAWSNSPDGLSLYNGSGLPAAPFRTDNW